MSSTLSAARPLGLEEGEYIVHAEPASTIDVLPVHASATSTFSRMRKNALLPLLFGLASIGTPALPSVRRVFSSAANSRSAISASDWLLVIDAFQYTEEPADAAEVRALNALLYLPITSGLELGLPE